MATAFGYAEIIALSQTGIQAAEQSFLELSSCVVQASWFDSAGNAYLPKLVNYQLVDVESKNVILSWASLTPATVNTVTVTSSQNATVNASRASETHEVQFQITDQNGDVFYAQGTFDLERVASFA